MVDYYQNRLTGILSALNEARRVQKRPVTNLLKKDIGYGERETILENTKDWKPFERFETWGGRETHACFRTNITIPDEWEGKTVAVMLQTGVTDIWNTDNPQFLVYINKKMICGHDMNHNEVILTDCARAGEVYEYGLYAYSNSSGKDVFLMLDAAVVQKDVEELYYDMKVPFEIAALLKKDDIRRTEYFQILNRAANLLNLCEVGSKEFYASVAAADAYLKSVFYTDKGKLTDSLPVTVHSIGHTHIDVAWKWPLRQTREKVLRSFATVLYEMERYPEYKFMSSQPQLYQFVKEESPQLYEKIKERVAEGRWETEGAMWLEADCNLSSGESLIRQIVYGKRFFLEEFGKQENKVLWLPDVFGYSAAMPQILKKSGIDYFMTTKIGWNEYNMIPNDTMLWKGIDGTEILTYFITTKDYITNPEYNVRSISETTYNGRQNANQIMGTWQRYQNKEINKEVLTCFGFGDGGGGPTVSMLEESRRMEYALPACPQVRQTFVRDFFDGLQKRLDGKKIPKWCGELYLEFHRGTYTSMARNKKCNRRAEFLNQDAESFSVFSWLSRLPEQSQNARQAEQSQNVRQATSSETDSFFPRERLRHVWELTLLNQFHDILPGSSIREVYEDSAKQYEEIFALDEEMILEALTILQKQNRGQQGAEETEKTEKKEERYITLYNNTSFARTDAVETNGQIEVYDGNRRLSSQMTSKGTTVWKPAEIPAKGYRVFTVKDITAKLSKEEHLNENSDTPGQKIQFLSTIRTLETPFYHVVFDEAWEISSLYDKQAEREIIKQGERANALLAFEDRPKEYDAWNIDPYYEEKCYPVNNIISAQCTEQGPVRTVFHVERSFHHSVIAQDIIFYEESPNIEFRTRIDWKESQILLKAAFPLDLVTTKASYEIQYGNVERPTHANTSWEQARFEVCAHKWADLAEDGYGVALLNDCKYGYDVRESTMRLTLLKSGIFPNPTADRESHEFTYVLLPHKGDFREGGVIRSAYQLNCPMYEQESKLPPEKTSGSFFSSSKENVIIETVKPAEEQNAIVLRVYESFGRRTKAQLLVPTQITACRECNLMEQPEREITCADGKIEFEIKPYEIKTFLLFT